MKKSTKIKLLALILVIIFIIIPMTVTVLTHNYHFGQRVVHENSYYEFLSTNNPDFKRELVNFSSDEGQMLGGAFYYQDDLYTNGEQPKGLLVFVHGMKVNHDNYLGEIEWFTQQNYVVFSFNNTGVDTSEGDDLKGLIQAPIDLQHALNYVYDLDLFNDMPNILIGHSWGGFSVASVSQLDIKREVDGIVTLAGFWRNINVIEDIAKYYVGDVISLFVPYLSLYEHFLFGENSSIDGVKGLNSTTAPVLIIHSQDDIIVTHQSNYLYYQEQFGNDPRFTFIEYIDAGHKLTINKEAYDRIHDIMHHQMEEEVGSEHYNELEEERLSLITDFNYDVMADVLNFCDAVVASYE